MWNTTGFMGNQVPQNGTIFIFIINCKKKLALVINIKMSLYEVENCQGEGKKKNCLVKGRL
jgi:hypothetical protein